MSFDRRPLTPYDAGDLAALWTAIEDADGSEEYLSEQDLREEFSAPGRDYPRGSMGIYDGRTMAGFGVLTWRATANPVHDVRHVGGVHPAYRGGGLGGELLAWAEQAAVPLHEDRHPGHPLALSSGCLSRNAAAVALHEARGYQPVRWFHSMHRDLSAPLPQVSAPAGVQIAGYTPAMAEHARLIRNESFRDHWGSTETSAEAWAHFLAHGAFRPGLSYLAYEGPEPLGMLISHEYDAYRDRTGLRDLYIALVGTRAAGRKRGIATALLATALSAARAEGYDQASLGVDADSLTGAVRLYERVGFAVDNTRTAYQKQLRLTPSPLRRGASLHHAGLLAASVAFDQVSAADGKLVRFGPEIGDPGDPAVVSELEEAQAGLRAVRPVELDPAGCVPALADDLLHRDVPVVVEAVHVEPDVGVPAADLLPGLRAAVDHMIG
jgi:mycothiol synthase